jgi:hypothetical protein
MITSFTIKFEIFLFSQLVLWVSLVEKDRVFPGDLKIPNKLRKFFTELPYPFPQNEGNCRSKKFFNFYLKNIVRSIDIPKYFMYKKYEYKKISMHF